MSYNRPPWIVRKVFNPALMVVAGRLGRGPRDIHVLSVPGRKSGVDRSVPVNVLSVDGKRYLLSPRGQTEWVKNLREAGSGTLSRGGVSEIVTVFELEDPAKPPILRAYLRQYANQAKGLFTVTEDASEESLLRAARDHPAFQIV